MGPQLHGFVSVVCKLAYKTVGTKVKESFFLKKESSSEYTGVSITLIPALARFCKTCQTGTCDNLRFRHKGYLEAVALGWVVCVFGISLCGPFCLLRACTSFVRWGKKKGVLCRDWTFVQSTLFGAVQSNRE